MVLISSLAMTPLCLIETPFKEKFGIPRQPLLIPEAWGKMEFEKNDFYAEAFRGIEEFSHLWLIFEFHEAVKEGAKALIRPPRFQGKEKWGVFASRSPHRPNHLGLSVVKFKKIDYGPNKITLWVEGVDLVNGTPIFDIKPYIRYADSVPEAVSGPFAEAPEFKNVVWKVEKPKDWQLIEKVIALDPRPGFDHEAEFGVSVAGYNVRFAYSDGHFVINKVTTE